MTSAVSIVIPSLGETAHFERHLPRLLEELAQRETKDEIIVVDDSGEGALEDWFEEHFAKDSKRIRVVSVEENGGYSGAVDEGARVARRPMLLVLHPDVEVRPGFLAPLVEALEADEAVFAVCPRVIASGDEGTPESHNAIRFEDGRLHVVARDASVDPETPRPVPFAPGCALLLRREEFAEAGGFDPLYAPFHWEDVDLCLHAWRRGQTVLEVPVAVVEHHRDGATTRGVIPEDLDRAASEKNRLLLFWKYLDTVRDAHDHVAALWRDALDASMAGRREDLIWMALALQELPRVSRSRARLKKAERSLDEVLRVSDPVG